MALQSSINKTILPNGAKVLSERVPYLDSVSVGVWALVGARDEDEDRVGTSHFVEHMLFKGTDHRSGRQIADEMDSLGGNLNAFTDKEFTCFYARILAEHLPKALDIISDMILCSTFDPQEMEREKNVVAEEIKRHRDTPEDRVHDQLAKLLWKGHPIANSVIGSDAVIRDLTRTRLIDYMAEFYRPNAILVSAAGNVDHARLVDMVVETFGELAGSRSVRVASDVEAHSGTDLADKTTEQVHFCLGTEGFAQKRMEKYALAVIDSTLGGGMSSRLFQEIRENRGLAYAIGSYSASYREAGLFAVYGGTSVQNFERVMDLTQSICESIGRDSVTEEELTRAKNQIRGALVLGQESMSNRMSRLAKSEIYFGRIIRLDEIVNTITQVSREDVAKVASQLFMDSRFALAAIGPFKKNSKLLGKNILSRGEA